MRARKGGARVETIVDDYIARLDAANDMARASTPPDDSAVLDLLAEMVVACTKALLETLGEPWKPEDSPDELIARATQAIRKHPEVFVDEAPFTPLEMELKGLHQVMRDLDYFRRGVGLLKNGHKPADMKWKTPGPVRTYVVNAFHRVASEFRPNLGGGHPLVRESEIDLAHTRAAIVELLRRPVGPDEFMRAAIDIGVSQTGSAGWDAFRDLPYEAELAKLSSFFVDVIARNPPGAPLAGLYAEIAYPSRGGKTVADLDVTGSDSYEPDDEDWFGSINYMPRDSLARSEILAKIYELAYAPGGLGNAADYTLCLAWGSYFARACARRYVAETGSDRIGLRAGFSGGDWIELGWIRST